MKGGPLLALALVISLVAAQNYPLAYLEFFSADLTIANRDQFHGMELNLNCPIYNGGNLTIYANNPNFQDPVSWVWVYISKGAAVSQFQPYPDPDDPKSYQWTTYRPNNSPLNSIFIQNAAGVAPYYLTIMCFAGTNCEYNIAATYVPPGAKSVHVNVGSRKQLLPTFPKLEEQTRLSATVVVQPLYVRNRMDADGSVKYHAWNITELPICASSLKPVFGNNNVCLSIQVIGKELGFLFYQEVTLQPSMFPPAYQWQTRPEDTQNPLQDLSGNGKLPINKWLSKPTLVNSLPNTLYHAVVGEGGQSSVTNDNLYIVDYEWMFCSS